MLILPIWSGTDCIDIPWNMLKLRFNVLVQERARLVENDLVCVQKEDLSILKDEGILTLHFALSVGHHLIFIM